MSYQTKNQVMIMLNDEFKYYTDTEVAQLLVELIKKRGIDSVADITKTKSHRLANMVHLSSGFNRTVLRTLGLKRVYIKNVKTEIANINNLAESKMQ